MKSSSRPPFLPSVFGPRSSVSFSTSTSTFTFTSTSSTIDYPLLFIVVTLVLVGLVVIYASTYHLGFRYLKWQFVRALAGFFALWVGTKINVLRLARRTVRNAILLITICALLGTVILGRIFGEIRELGVFQPQEFAKLGILIWLAGYFSNLNENNPNPDFVKSILIPGSAVGLVVLLTLLQPAFGTAVLIALSSCAVFVFARVRWRYLLILAMMAAILFVGALLAMPSLHNTRYEYILNRWANFRQGDRYHQTQALIALGSGGPFGRGLGEGRQKFYFIPKLPKDFIFCALGEDFGFAGCVVIMVLYGMFFIRVLRIAERNSSEFGQILSLGIGTMINLYALTHIAVSLSLLPTTGQPLPFISYGGSALISNLLTAGILLKISRYQRRVLCS